MQLGQAHRQRALQAGVEGGVHPLFVDGGQPAVVAAGARQPLQRLPRLGLGRLFGERARPGGEGLPGIEPLDLLDARDLGQHAQARRHGVLDLEAQLGQLDDGVPLARGAQDRIQRRHRLQAVVAAARDGPQRLARLGVPRRARQDALVARDRPLDVGQLGLDQARGAEGQLVVGGAIGLARHAHVQDLEEVGVPPLARENAVQRVQRLAIGRAVVEDGAQLAHRLVGFAQLLVIQVRRLQAQQPPVADALGDLDLALEDLGQLAPRDVGQVQLRQRVQRLDVAVVDAQHVLPGADRAVGLLQRQLVEHGDALGDELAVGGSVAISRCFSSTSTSSVMRAAAVSRRSSARNASMSSGRADSAERQASMA